MKQTLDECRAIAIAPCSRGLGFVVMEGPETLIDWGLKIVRSDKNRESLKRVTELINRYPPDLVVIEDYRHKSCRRAARVRALLKDTESLAKSKGIETRRVTQSALKNIVSRDNASTKHRLAVEIVKKFPELAPRLPRLRKPWMAEDARMSIFIALGLALACSSMRKEACFTGNEKAKHQTYNSCFKGD